MHGECVVLNLPNRAGGLFNPGAPSRVRQAGQGFVAGAGLVELGFTCGGVCVFATDAGDPTRCKLNPLPGSYVYMSPPPPPRPPPLPLIASPPPPADKPAECMASRVYLHIKLVQQQSYSSGGRSPARAFD